LWYLWFCSMHTQIFRFDMSGPHARARAHSGDHEKAIITALDPSARETMLLPCGARRDLFGLSVLGLFTGSRCGNKETILSKVSALAAKRKSCGVHGTVGVWQHKKDD
jgi:hypothetical protein